MNCVLFFINFLKVGCNVIVLVKVNFFKNEHFIIASSLKAVSDPDSHPYLSNYIE